MASLLERRDKQTFEGALTSCRCSMASELDALLTALSQSLMSSLLRSMEPIQVEFDHRSLCDNNFTVIAMD